MVLKVKGDETTFKLGDFPPIRGQSVENTTSNSDSDGWAVEKEVVETSVMAIRTMSTLVVIVLMVLLMAM